jgi:hypothetical protein
MKPKLCAAGETLRDQINKAFVDRDKTSDGWIGDARHSATESQHNPDYSDPNSKWAWVRAIDIDADLGGAKNNSDYLADQIRLCAKAGESRIAYCIFKGRIASSKKSWAWRPYSGFSRHDHHIHVSFTKKGDLEGSLFPIPLLGEI